MLGITSVGLSHENNIYKNNYIIDKWYKIRVLCLWFYRIKLLVDNQFDDIGAIIINSEEDIDLDVMNTNQKTLKSFALLLPS